MEALHNERHYNEALRLSQELIGQLSTLEQTKNALVISELKTGESNASAIKKLRAEIENVRVQHDNINAVLPELKIAADIERDEAELSAKRAADEARRAIISDVENQLTSLAEGIRVDIKNILNRIKSIDDILRDSATKTGVRAGLDSMPSEWLGAAICHEISDDSRLLKTVAYSRPRDLHSTIVAWFTAQSWRGNGNG